MATLTRLFKGSDSALGVFYPTDYIIAIFPTFAAAQEASQALRGAGLSKDEVLAIPGSEVLKYFEEFRAHSGYWASIMTVLSRAFGTEQVFADGDVESAHAGKGFVAVYSPGEGPAARVRDLVKPFEPETMHWYHSGGVECMI